MVARSLSHLTRRLSLRRLDMPNKDTTSVGSTTSRHNLRTPSHLRGRIQKVSNRYDSDMITCVLHYQIAPDRIDAFEEFAREWIRLVNKHGGQHHGYFLPAEGANDEAEALFSFESLAAYERYRQLFHVDPEFIAADKIRDESGCVIRYTRTFMRPLLAS